MFKIEELKLGGKYQLAFTEETDPGYSPECYYEGTGILELVDPSGYPKGTIRFKLPELNEVGYFGVESIVAEIKDAPGMPKNIEVIDSNDNGTLALVRDTDTGKCGLVSQTSFIPCKDDHTANIVFQLLKRE